ncbi:casein kinase I, partial [Aphelenchoides avenae]
MKRQRLFGERVPRNNRQSSNFQSVTQKELYIWCEEKHKAQRVSVNQNALHHCLRNGKDPLTSKDAVKNYGGASTREQDGLRHGDHSQRGGHSRGLERGTQRLNSRGHAAVNALTHRSEPASSQGQRGATWHDNDRQQNSRGSRSGYFNGNNQRRDDRRQTSIQQSGLADSGYNRPQHNRGSLRESSHAKHRPHRLQNAIEAIEALNETDQKARVHSKVGMLVNKRFEVQQMLDQGSYGQIFVGFDHLHLRKVAVKFDEGKRKAERTSSSKRNHLKDEYDIYTTIRNNHPCGKLEGIPEPYRYGEEFGFRILALELLGASLHALFTFCDYKLGLETVFEIGQQMLERVRVVHES